VKILQPAFFARQDTRTPMRFSLISVAVNIVLGVALFYTLGFQGIAVATSVATWITVAQMAVALARQDAYRPSARASFKMGRVVAASLVMGLGLAVAGHFRPALEAPLAHVAFAGLHAKEISDLLLSAAGVVTYPVLLFAFGGVTPAELRLAFRRGKGDPAPAVQDLP
jgi:putative peptidoglycan lipid II flippase